MSKPAISPARRRYQRAAIMLMNVVVALVVINVLLGIGFGIYDAVRDDRVDYLQKVGGFDELREVYPGLDDDAILDLSKETWSRPVVYAPWTQFQERPFRGRFYTVDENGFRHVGEQGPWPPDPSAYNVFVLGGSTTFGYGVPDAETVPAYLQDLLAEALGRRVHVYNFGQSYYYSTQSRALFDRLLFQDHVPDLAIFVSGLNDFYNVTDAPEFSHRLERVFVYASEFGKPKKILSQLRDSLPMGRGIEALKDAVRSLWRSDVPPRADLAEASLFPPEEYQETERLLGTVDRYYKNVTAIEALAARYEVPVVFAWQPIPTYGYDLEHHSFVREGFGDHSYSHYGYPLMKSRLAEQPLGDNFLWCADMQQGLAEPLYVDQLHYTAAMARRLAERMVGLMLERGLLPIDAG